MTTSHPKCKKVSWMSVRDTCWSQSQLVYLKKKKYPLKAHMSKFDRLPCFCMRGPTSENCDVFSFWDVTHPNKMWRMICWKWSLFWEQNKTCLNWNSSWRINSGFLQIIPPTTEPLHLILTLLLLVPKAFCPRSAGPQDAKAVPGWCTDLFWGFLLWDPTGLDVMVLHLLPYVWEAAICTDLNQRYRQLHSKNHEETSKGCC